MNTPFSAPFQALGYLYQARYALYLILEGREEVELSIESLDDVVFEEGGTPHELLQLKHHGSPASLTNTSRDLWKTIRIWSIYLKEKTILPDTLLTLVTTARASDNSIAALLRPATARLNEPASAQHRSTGTRDPSLALQKMLEVAKTSNNKKLKSAFEAFLALSAQQQEMLVASIQVLDCSPNISDTATQIKDKIRWNVRREHLEGVYERLEGWWFDKVVCHLSGRSTTPITGFEVHDKIVEITEQFRPDALPIDFLDAFPATPLDPEGDTRRFVAQLRAIAIKNRRIEKAILDYFRAFEQRSRWAREELLIGGELSRYERKLVDEWERYTLALEDELEIDEADESKLQKHGRKIYNWMELNANIPIRPRVTEAYVMRGSFHMLADKNPPSVWWHPKFVERLEDLLSTK